MHVKTNHVVNNTSSGDIKVMELKLDDAWWTKNTQNHVSKFGHLHWQRRCEASCGPLSMCIPQQEKIESALQNQSNYIQLYFYTILYLKRKVVWSKEPISPWNVGLVTYMTICTWNLQEIDHLIKNDYFATTQKLVLHDFYGVCSHRWYKHCFDSTGHRMPLLWCPPVLSGVINHMIDYRHYRYITNKK